MSGHFGTITVVPKCLRSEVSWHRKSARRLINWPRRCPCTARHPPETSRQPQRCPSSRQFVTFRDTNYYPQFPTRSIFRYRKCKLHNMRSAAMSEWPNFKHKRHTHTHTRLSALCPGLPRWAGTRKVKPIWILLKQETVSGSGISWTICESAPHSRQITTPVPHHFVFYRPDTLPVTQPTASKHWRQFHMLQ